MLHREILASHECCRQYGIDPLGTRNLSQVQLNPEELNVRREQKKTFWRLSLDGLLKSPKSPFFVIPADAGIQYIETVTKPLDSGFHRSDDFQITKS